MSLRAYTDHVDDYNRTHTIEIHKSGYSGSVDYLKNTGSGYASFDYEKIDPKNPTDNPIQKGALEFSLWLQSSTLIDEIKTADEQTFWAVHKVDGTQEWIGYIYNDLSTYEEGFENHPFRITLMAKDFTDLGGKDYLVSGSLPDSRERVIATIAHLLDTVGFDMPIKTHTSWIEENVEASLTDYDYLNQIYHETKALREFGRTGDESDQPITVEDALNKLCVNHGLLLKQANGAYWIDQLTEYETPTSVQEATYDLTGSQTAFSTTNDLTVDANTNDLKVTISQDNRDNSGLPGLKRVKNKFDHRTGVTTIDFPDFVEFGETEDTYSDTQFFISDGSQRLSLFGRIYAEVPSGTPNVVFQYQIDVAGENWDEENQQWVTGTVLNTIDLTSAGSYGSVDTYRLDGFSVETLEVPSGADGQVTITFYSVREEGAPSGHYTRISNASFNIINAIADENSTSINYQLTQTGDYSVVSEIEDTWFGDGPIGYSVAALRFSSSDADVTGDTWQRKGSTAYRNFHHNLLAEHLDVRRGWRRLLSATLKGLYYPWQVLSYDSEYFYFLGGSWDLFTGNWEGELFRLDIQTASDDTFDDIPKFTDETGSGSGPTSSGGGGGGLDQSTADARYLQEANNLSDLDSASSAISNLGITATASELNILDGATLSTAELNLLDGVTATTAELNQLDGNVFTGLTTHQSGIGVTGGSVDIATSTPEMSFTETDQANKEWRIDLLSEQFRIVESGVLVWMNFDPNANELTVGESTTISGLITAEGGAAIGTGNYITSEGNSVHISDNSVDPVLLQERTGNSTNEKAIGWRQAGGGYNLQLYNDDYTRGDTVVKVTRSGSTASSVEINTSLGINTPPTEALDVNGNVTTSGSAPAIVSNGFYSNGVSKFATVNIDTLRTTLFKPNSVSGMGGEFIFNGTSKVVSIDTGANEIVVEDGVFGSGDAIIVSSLVGDTGFSKTRLNITGNATTSNPYTYPYSVDATSSGADTDIESGYTAVKVDGNSIHVNANEADASAPFMKGYDQSSGFDLLDGNATAAWEITEKSFIINGSEGITTLTQGTFEQEKVTGNGGILIDALDSLGSRIDVNGESGKVVRFQEGSNPIIGTPTSYSGSTGGSANSLPSQPVAYIPIEFDADNLSQQVYVIPIYNPASTPATPTNVTLCSASNPDGIRISWDNMNVDSYEVERAESSSGPWALIGTTTTTSFLDDQKPPLEPNTTFYYRVRSVDNGLTSGWSDVKSGSYNSLGACA